MPIRSGIAAGRTQQRRGALVSKHRSLITFCRARWPICRAADT